MADSQGRRSQREMKKEGKTEGERASERDTGRPCMKMKQMTLIQEENVRFFVVRRERVTKET